jgi:hypothetical protein
MAVGVRVSENRSSWQVAMAVTMVVVVAVGRVRISTFPKGKGIMLLDSVNWINSSFLTRYPSSSLFLFFSHLLHQFCFWP